MRAKTELQKRVEALSDKGLGDLNDAQWKWCIHHVFSKYGYKTRGYVVCSICRHKFKSTRKRCTCPHCGHQLEVRSSKNMRRVERMYVTLPDICEEFQVIRHFIAKRTMYLYKPIYYDIYEVVQVWISPDGRRTVMAKPIAPLTYDNWIPYQPMEIRRMTDKHDINSWIIPGGKVFKEARKRGVNLKMFRKYYSAPDELIVKSIKTTFVEYLLKVGQLDMLKYYLRKCDGEYKYRNAVRICTKHNYIIKDASLWHDYVGLLEYFNLDIHSPHYLCPENVVTEHNRLMQRKLRIEAEERLKEKLKEAAKYESNYKRKIKPFIGLCFDNGKIFIHAIQSVKEMAEEGTYLHHCVFSMGYYKQPNTLILSARDEQGTRLETIELNTKTMEVIQSRGLMNKKTEYHEEILELMQKNMNLIRLLKRKRKRPKI